MGIKKSLYLSDLTMKFCHQMKTTGETNWSGSINCIVAQYSVFVTENMPDLTEGQKNAIYCAYNGYIPHPDIKEEANLLHWHISEGWEYDEQIKDFLGTKQQAIDFISLIKSWSISEKMAVIYLAKSFWRTGPVVEPEDA